jgi:hypothetical protein
MHFRRISGAAVCMRATNCSYQLGFAQNCRQSAGKLFFTSSPRSTYTAKVFVHRSSLWLWQIGLSRVLLVLGGVPSLLCAQQATKPEKPPTNQDSAKTPTDSGAQIPAQIELLETRFRFAVDGSSRKEVHARVRINTELGTRQFARLNFDYNRALETVEIPLARITHAGGGTVDILPSAVSDQPHPAVVDASAYQEVRRKTVRILGLQPTDELEYRVITATTNALLAPDFYLFHTFAKDAIVAEEKFELDLPAARAMQIRVNPSTPGTTDNETAGRVIRRWEYKWASTDGKASYTNQDVSAEPDVTLTTFTSWKQLSARLAENFMPKEDLAGEVIAKSAVLTKTAKTPEEKIEAIYDFVSQKVTTLELPLGSTGFHARAPAEILTAGYATAEDKMVLFAALLRAAKMPAIAALTGAPETAETLLPRPSMFTRALVWTGKDGPGFWLDPSVGVAPFRMIASNLRGKAALLLLPDENDNAALSRWLTVPVELPFAALQKVNVNAVLAADGKLTAKVHYVLRGDNELLLRIAFHQTAKEKWKDLAQLLSISDGFRGKVTSVNASDPAETRQPFTVDYEIAMPKFVDWSKKPVRIPALLPQVGLPDAPAKMEPGAATTTIELGTPLDVETHATLELPSGTIAHPPAGTSVERDYAVFSSNYGARDLTATASRHIRFLLREVPAERASDYKAFIHAVQNDEAQDFTLERPDGGVEQATPAVKKTSTRTAPN